MQSTANNFKEGIQFTVSAPLVGIVTKGQEYFFGLPVHDPIEAHFIGRGHFHLAYKFTLSAGHPLMRAFYASRLEDTFKDISTSQSFVLKIPIDQKCGIVFVKKEAESFNLINKNEMLYAEPVAIKIGERAHLAEVFPFVDGEAIDDDHNLAEAVKLFYKKSQLILLDALSHGNVMRCRDSEVICVDAGCAISEEDDPSRASRYYDQWLSLMDDYPKTICTLLFFLCQSEVVNIDSLLFFQEQLRKNIYRLTQGLGAQRSQEEVKNAQKRIAAYQEGYRKLVVTHDTIIAERKAVAQEEKVAQGKVAQSISPVKRGRYKENNHQNIIPCTPPSKCGNAECPSAPKRPRNSAIEVTESKTTPMADCSNRLPHPRLNDLRLP